MLPGAQISYVCAPGSTNQHQLCSREHKQAVFVLPGAQTRFVLPGAQELLNCAPWSTSVACLCSREHKYRRFVPPVAQMSLDCAPGSTTMENTCCLFGSTIKHYLCSGSMVITGREDLRAVNAQSYRRYLAMMPTKRKDDHPS